MPRCGCASGAQILLQGSAPVVVTGAGTPGSPFVVGLAHGGETGCAAVAACVGDHLGPGLQYISGAATIQARLSTDAGNALSFGSDNGLFSVDATSPSPSTCAQKTVASLAEMPADSPVWGAWRQGGLLNAWPSLEGVDHLLDQGIDIIHVNVAASADGVACLTFGNDGLTTPGLTPVTATTQVRNMTSGQWRRLVSKAGHWFDPFSNRQTPDGTDPNAYGGGWWGWRAPEFNQITLYDLLKRVGGRAVVLADCSTGGSNSIESNNITAALRAVTGNCAQDNTFIGINNTGSAATVIAAGCTPMLVSNAAYTWGSTTLPWPVANVTAAGIQWMATQRNMADATHTTYRDAGINVLISWGDRHVDRARMTTLALRGAFAHDPVYMRGHAVREYRTTLDPFRQRTIGPGVLTHITSDARETYRIVDTASSGRVRGYCEPEGYMGLPPGWGGMYGRPSVLMGWACPLVNPNTYVIEFQGMFRTLPTFGATSKFGILFGAPDDTSTFAWPVDAGFNPRQYPEGARQYYRAYQRPNGAIGIGVFKPGTGAFMYLNGSSESESASGMETDTPPPNEETWQTYRLTVSPTTITWRRTTANGTQYTHSVTNSDWRGPYFFMEKEESFAGTSDQFNPGRQFNAAFRNFVITSV